MDNFFCSFCGIKIYPGHGSLLVRNNLKFYYFCRSKCKKLSNLKKNPLFFRWTNTNRVSRGLSLEKSIKKKMFPLMIKSTKTYNNQAISRVIYEIQKSEINKHKKFRDYLLQKRSIKNKVV